MIIKTYFGGSCAVASCERLGDHSSAKDAMLGVCLHELGPCKKQGFGTSISSIRDLTPFYTFIAGPEVKAGAPGSSHHSKSWVAYGTEFAQFIIDHGLGRITTLPKKLNKKYHPDTTCQIWIWDPDLTAITQWYMNNAKEANCL